LTTDDPPDFCAQILLKRRPICAHCCIFAALAFFRQGSSSMPVREATTLVHARCSAPVTLPEVANVGFQFRGARVAARS
jgi:hypothetical protein